MLVNPATMSITTTIEQTAGGTGIEVGHAGDDSGGTESREKSAICISDLQ